MNEVAASVVTDRQTDRRMHKRNTVTLTVRMVNNLEIWTTAWSGVLLKCDFFTMRARHFIKEWGAWLPCNSSSNVFICTKKGWTFHVVMPCFASFSRFRFFFIFCNRTKICQKNRNLEKLAKHGITTRRFKNFRSIPVLERVRNRVALYHGH